MADALIQAGATAIVGTHAHVVQQWQFQTNPFQEKLPILYATGNFVSGQVRFERRVGALAWLQLCQAPMNTDTGLAIHQKLELAHLGWMPLLMQRTAKGPKLSPVVGDNLKAEFLSAQRLMAKYVPPTGLKFEKICKSTKE